MIITVYFTDIGYSHRTPSDPGIGSLFHDDTSIPGYAVCIDGIQDVKSQSRGGSSTDSFAQDTFLQAQTAYQDIEEAIVANRARDKCPDQKKAPGKTSRDTREAFFLQQEITVIQQPNPESIVEVFATTKKKYKPVAKKVRPVPATLPDKFRIKRVIEGDPLEHIPRLPINPPEFEATGRYTQARKEIIDKVHPGTFLWPAERRLMHYFMMVQNEGFAWDETEKGTFNTKFFPPVDMAVMPHTPWVLKNIPIPPGLYAQIIDTVRDKIRTGTYEPSNSSYRSRWFAVGKKDSTAV